MLTKVSQNFRIPARDEVYRANRKGRIPLPELEDPSHPPEQGRQILLLHVHVYRLVMKFGVDDDRQIELLRVRAGKSGISISTPLHRGSNAVAVAEVEIISHSDFIAVVKDGRPRK